MPLQTLRDRRLRRTDGIVLRKGLNQKALEEDGCELQMSPVNMPAQEKAWYCGRICCEGDHGNINASSVLLEGANGKRVRLDLSHVMQFAVFPGQIVVLRGNNTSGESIIVREMWSDATLPMAKTPADKMATWNETEAFLGGMPLSIMTASGPFTSSADLTYKPIQDLLDHAAQQKPDVLILTGPFVDCKHRQLNPESAGTVGGFNDPPDSLQVVRHVMRDLIAERLSAGSPTTTCVLVPCLEDLHSRTTFPQPPFDQAEIIQAMDGEMDVAQRVDVQIVGNPCMLRINEILVSALPTPSVACPATKPRAALVTVSRASSATSCSSEVFTRSFRQMKGAKCQRPTSATLACSRRPTSCCSPACSTPLPRGSGTSCVSIPANSPGAAGLAPSPASRFIPLFATCGQGLLEDLARSLLALLSRLRPWSIPPTINAEPLAAEGEAAQAEVDSMVDAAEEDKVESSGAPAPDDQMEVDGAAAVKAEGEGAAGFDVIDAVNASSDKKAPAHVGKTDTDDSKAEVAHRVCERTRVDLVRI
jgi:hypothetical protein